MSSPDRNFIFNEEILPQTPDGISLPAPRGPVVPGGPATPGSPVAAAAAAAPSYPLDGPEQPSPSEKNWKVFIVPWKVVVSVEIYFQMMMMMKRLQLQLKRLKS